MYRNNIFTRTGENWIPKGISYYDHHAQMSFLDFGEPVICYKEDILRTGERVRITNKKLLSTLNNYERLHFCHSVGEVFDLRKYNFGFHIIVTGQSIHVLSGVTSISIEIVPEYKFSSEQLDYLFKNHSETLKDVRTVLLDLKHPYRCELIYRMSEVLKNWKLIQMYESLLPKDYLIRQDGKLFEVFDEYDRNIAQRSGCSRKFKTLRAAIQFLWTVETTESGWTKVRTIKEIPLEIRRKIREAAA